MRGLRLHPPLATDPSLGDLATYVRTLVVFNVSTHMRQVFVPLPASMLDYSYQCWPLQSVLGSLHAVIFCYGSYDAMRCSWS